PVRPVKNTNTGLEYCTIQAAIDDPATNDLVGDHDVITVAAGTYAEHVTVDKTLTIIGAGSGTNPLTNTVVQGFNANSDVIKITKGGLNSTERTTIKDICLI